MYKLLKFGADWCGPCRLLTNEIKKTPIEGVEVVEIDVDQADDLVDVYGITQVPELILKDDNGQVLWRHQGYLPTQQIQQTINQYIYEQ